MEKRYDDQLTIRLEEIITRGAAQFTWAEIRQWYGKERVAAKVYRDLDQRWAELTAGEYGNIICVPVSHAWRKQENYGFWAFSDSHVKTFHDLAESDY